MIDLVVVIVVFKVDMCRWDGFVLVLLSLNEKQHT